MVPKVDLLTQTIIQVDHIKNYISNVKTPNFKDKSKKLYKVSRWVIHTKK